MKYYSSVSDPVSLHLTDDLRCLSLDLPLPPKRDHGGHDGLGIRILSGVLARSSCRHEFQFPRNAIHCNHKWINILLLRLTLLMIGSANRHFYGTPDVGLRFGVPKVWSRALDLKSGEPCEVLFDEILIVIPARSKGSKQAERVLKAMREARP